MSYISLDKLNEYDEKMYKAIHGVDRPNEKEVDTDNMTDEEVVKHFRKLNAEKKEKAAYEKGKSYERMWNHNKSSDYTSSSSILSKTSSSPATTMLRFL